MTQQEQNEAVQEQNEAVMGLLTSDFAKTLVSILITTITFSYFVFSSTTDIKNQVKEVQHKIELQNATIEYRLKNIEDRQDRDYKEINEKFVKKLDLKNIKGIN